MKVSEIQKIQSIADILETHAVVKKELTTLQELVENQKNVYLAFGPTQASLLQLNNNEVENVTGPRLLSLRTRYDALTSDLLNLGVEFDVEWVPNTVV